MKKLFALLLASAIVFPAFAETKAEEPISKPTYSPILPVKIKPRQEGADAMSKAAADIEQENSLDPDTLGLYTRVSDGGLGSDLWKDYTAPTLAEDLRTVSPNISSPTMRGLLLRALLTTPDAFDADDKNIPGSVFSARIALLVDLGAFDETVLLYKKLEGNIPLSVAALAGVESIVSSGQMGLACLEEKALSPNLKTSSGANFWPDLKNFCNILLTTDTPAKEDNAASLAKTAQAFSTGKNLSPVSSLKELNGKSVVEIVSMDKAHLIPENIFTPDQVRTLKPEIIALLLAQSPASPAEKLSLLAVAAEKGMVPPLDFISAFQVQSKLSDPVPGYWQSVLKLYGQIQSAADDTARSSLLKEALKTAGPGSNAALLPFAASFGSLKNIDSFSSNESRQVVALLVRAKMNVPGVWFAKAFDRPDIKNQDSVTDLDVIHTLEESLSADQVDDRPKSAKKDGEASKVIEIAQLHTLSLILQSEEAEDKNVKKSYEKLLSLTAENDYVMPSKELMNNLKQASDKQDTGKIILYSLQVLNGQRVSQLHPAALFRISEGLRSVGLSEENTSLAHEALADLIEIRK